MSGPSGKKARTARLDPDALASLEEQRDFLLRSLEDLEREHEAGDLDDEDFEALRDDYTVRAADVLRAIEQQRTAFDEARRPRSKGRMLAVAAGVGVFALLSGVMVASALGARKAGETSSGGIGVEPTLSQQANECNQLGATDPEGSYACLEEVLAKDPKNPVALTWSAWALSRSADNFAEPDRSTAKALAAVRLQTAVEEDPDYSYARAFRAVVAFRNGRYEEAARFLEEFEANDPAADAVNVIEQMELRSRIEERLAEDPP